MLQSCKIYAVIKIFNKWYALYPIAKKVYFLINIFLLLLLFIIIILILIFIYFYYFNINF